MHLRKIDKISKTLLVLVQTFKTTVVVIALNTCNQIKLSASLTFFYSDGFSLHVDRLSMDSPMFVFQWVTGNIIQLMHSFEVNTRICQPENSDVHRG